MNKIEKLQLSVRSMNALKSYYIYTIKDLIVLSEPDLLRLPCLGRKSLNEIKTALNQIGLSLGMNPDEIETDDSYSKKITIKTSFDLMKYMGISKNITEEYREKYQDSGVNVFRIMDFVLTKKFTQRELIILKSRNDYWNENKLTLQALGKRLGITRERVRQIETKANKKLWTIIEGLLPSSSLIDLRQQYGFNRDFIDDVSVINEQDNTNFSNHFLYRTLAILLKNDYLAIIDNKNKCQYLINKTISKAFDFRGFINEIDALLTSTDIDYKLTLKGLQYEYYEPIMCDDDVIDDTINKICGNLLYSEFNIILDVDNNITIKSKKQKFIVDYVEEALISNNKPSHLNDIYKAIKNQYPAFSKSLKSVRNAIVRNDKFIFFDRNSTYGLKIWEGELTQHSILIDIVKPNQTKKDRSGIKVWNEKGKVIVRGGTMINIVVDYLEKFQEPQHIDDIFIEVDKWRETSKSRLMGNLKVNNIGYFAFENMYVGLFNE